MRPALFWRRATHWLFRLPAPQLGQISLITREGPEVIGFAFQPNTENSHLLSTFFKGLQKIHFSGFRIDEFRPQIIEYLGRKYCSAEATDFVVKVCVCTSSFLFVTEPSNNHLAWIPFFIIDTSGPDKKLTLFFRKSQQ